MAGKQVYLSDEGNDKNDGLTPRTAVLTSARAKAIAADVKHPVFDIKGGAVYVRRMKAELGVF